MTTVEWLSRGKYIQTEIKELKETYWTGVEQNEEYPLSALEDYTGRIASLIDTKYKVLHEITDMVHSLPDERYRHILFGLYIAGQSIPQVAKELCISDTWVKELHKRALKEVEKILEELKATV